MNAGFRLSPYSFGTAVAAAMILAAGCRTTIEEGLTDEQANQVIGALYDGAIVANKEADKGDGRRKRYRVSVPSRDAARSLALLRSVGLPRPRTAGWKDVIDSAGIVPTVAEERARLTAALCGELARSIEAVDGVLEARVHIAVPDTRVAPPGSASPKTRASVLLKYSRAGQPIDDRAIRALVAGAVPEMDPGDVTVVAVAVRALRDNARGVVQIGPLVVTRSSAPTLIALSAASLLAHLTLALTIVFILVRIRRG